MPSGNTPNTRGTIPGVFSGFDVFSYISIKQVSNICNFSSFCGSANAEAAMQHPMGLLDTAQTQGSSVKSLCVHPCGVSHWGRPLLGSCCAVGESQEDA